MRRGDSQRMSGGIAGAAQDRSRVIALSRATSSKRDTFRGTFMIAIRRRHDLGLTTASIQIRVELGLLLRPLHARIEREIRAGLDTHLGHEDARTADRAAPSA